VFYQSICISAIKRIFSTTAMCMYLRLPSRDDHYPVYRLNIRQDSEFATGYGYPKTNFKRERDTDPDIRNGFVDVSRIQTFRNSCTLHNHSRYEYGTIIYSLSSEASFQLSVP